MWTDGVFHLDWVSPEEQNEVNLKDELQRRFTTPSFAQVATALAKNRAHAQRSHGPRSDDRHPRARGNGGRQTREHSAGGAPEVDQGHRHGSEPQVLHGREDAPEPATTRVTRRSRCGS